MLYRKMLLVASLCAAAWGQTTLTTIQDTLFNADGTLYNGSLFIQWGTFDTTQPGTVVQQSLTVPVINGNLLVKLVPNANQAAPANIYTVLYQSGGRQQFTETWSVPASTVALKVSQIRTGTISGGGSNASGGGGSAGGQSSVTEANVTNLVSDLAQRPMKGPGFGVNAVAMVDGNGLLETVPGNIGDCVLVDGTSGPCGSGSSANFADAETPVGSVNGTNAVFTLANTPTGTSLLVFRNGLYQKAGVDYNLSGSTITFVAGAIPGSGDVLAAHYRY
jgi:hypothetical protein